MVSVSIDGRQVAEPAGATLFDCAESVGVRVPTSCVKRGRCRECLVEIEEGAGLLSERAREEEHLGEGFRLACRARVVDGDGEVRCHTLRRGQLRIVDEASGVAAPSVEPRDGFGVAVDVGTTTVAVRLHDLTTGRLVAAQSFENPQRFGGSDVMARIHYDASHDGRLLKRTLVGYLRHALEDFPVEGEAIVEMVVVGNSTMRDLFFGRDVTPIGEKPYRSTDEGSLEASTRSLGLPLHPDAVVHGLPLLGSHVGADAAACLLATRMHESDDVTLLMDLGTNTELVIGNRERLLVASCPAGPAFEGGGVRCGMPALEGAVERVSLPEDGAPRIGVIGGGEPLGLCGSGLVDLMSELLRSGRMNAQGRFDEEMDELVLTERVRFGEADVNELAQAKGANAAGLRIVADAFGVALGSVDRFLLAGGFARHLDVDAARRIGLVPNLPDDRVSVVGNAALEGASQALLAPSRRRELEDVVSGIDHVELELHPEFFDYFVEGCQFVPIGEAVVEA